MENVVLHCGHNWFQEGDENTIVNTWSNSPKYRCSWCKIIIKSRWLKIPKWTPRASASENTHWMMVFNVTSVRFSNWFCFSKVTEPDSGTKCGKSNKMAKMQCSSHENMEASTKLLVRRRLSKWQFAACDGFDAMCLTIVVCLIAMYELFYALLCVYFSFILCKSKNDFCLSIFSCSNLLLAETHKEETVRLCQCSVFSVERSTNDSKAIFMYTICAYPIWKFTWKLACERYARIGCAAVAVESK